MITKIVNMYDLIACLTNTGDLISSEIADHHRQVSYLAYRIAESYGMSKQQQREILLAGLLHDVGAFALKERLELLENEESPTAQNHAFIGASILEEFEPLRNVANIIRFHHIAWGEGRGAFYKELEVPEASHILHLADRVAAMLKKDHDVIGQISPILKSIQSRTGKSFHPLMVDALTDIAGLEYIWLDTVYNPLMTVMPKIVNLEPLEMDINDVVQLSGIFANLIDFRSPFTATHSSGVAAVANKIAEIAAFSENECKYMLIAGYLHDLGKLTVSNDILEKQGGLDEKEFNAIRGHTFYTYRTLQSLKNFETINLWASLHHERLDGNGYPFHLKAEEIPLGSRIMAVADVFTAITEDRPYRLGMSAQDAKGVLQNMVKSGALCPNIVNILNCNFDMLSELRQNAQNRSGTQYEALQDIGAEA